MFDSPTQLWQEALAWWQLEVPPRSDPAWSAIRLVTSSPSSPSSASSRRCTATASE